MRLLSVSNGFPPHENGGYEQLCAEVSLALAARGHEVHVLTERSPPPAVPEIDGPIRVHRRLHVEVVGGLIDTVWRLVRHWRRLEQENLCSVQALVHDVEPDAVLIWGMWNVPRSVPRHVEDLLPGRVAYYLCDYWPTLDSAFIQRFDAPARRPLAGLLKRMVSWPARSFVSRTQPKLKFEHVLCVSEAVARRVRADGVPVPTDGVLHQGIDVGLFAAAASSRSPWSKTRRLRLLYAGRLAPTKGVHVAIRALAQLGDLRESVTLDVVGGGEPQYEQSLRNLVQQLGLSEQITFRSSVPRDQMPDLLAQYDVLVFPSQWEEPLARMPMEAMAAGLVVVGTTTGGSGELLRHEDTALTFEAGDAAGLAHQVRRLLIDPELQERLLRNGSAEVHSRFTIERMIDCLDEYLRGIATRTSDLRSC